MTSLTTRQRDILKILLEADQPLGTGEIANNVKLSARQVNYSMRGIEKWLKTRDVQLQTKPGVGTIISSDFEKKEKILQELEGSSHLQLILTPEQRQQLLCLYLLFQTEPVILTQLAQLAKVSRTTILADLDLIETWLISQDIKLERKQNHGISIESTEKIRQQAILNFLWGENPFGPPLLSITFQSGLNFSLHQDANLLPLIEKINAILNLVDLKKIFNKVVLVEDFLSGRFTDEAVLFLALVLSILIVRLRSGNHIETPVQDTVKLKMLPSWNAAIMLIQNLDCPESLSWIDNDIFYIEMNILSCPRVDNWPSDNEQDSLYKELGNELISKVSQSYELEPLLNDPTLRDGLINHLIPVSNQQRFKLWFPKSQEGLPYLEKYSKEYSIAENLVEIIHQHTRIELPQEETGVIAALLRAAYIRFRPHHLKKVLVICPSGMATAQLLTARLNTRFPHLGKLTVVSFRELEPLMIAEADLIITLMPLPEDMVGDRPVVQVSPQLLPEDVEAITDYLT